MLGAASVVLLHVFSTLTANTDVVELGMSRSLVWSASSIVLTRWAVPVFLMISGALLLDPSRVFSVQKQSRYVLRMVVVLATFGYAYCLMELVFGANGVSAGLLFQALVNLLSGASWDHMWYVYDLIGIYLLLPMLRAFAVNASQAEYRRMLTVLLILSLAVPTVNAALNVHLSTFLWLTSTGFYVLLGRYAVVYLRSPRQWCQIGFICMMISVAVKLYFVSQGIWASWIELPSNPLIAGQALMVFLVAKRFLDVPCAGIGARLARTSFGIYLIHPLILNIAYKVLGISPSFYPPLVFELGMWAVAFVGSYLLVCMLMRVPLFRRIL